MNSLELSIIINRLKQIPEQERRGELKQLLGAFPRHWLDEVHEVANELLAVEQKPTLRTAILGL